MPEELRITWELDRHPLRASADEQIRSALSEEARPEAMRGVGREADLQELLEGALREAETALAAPPDSQWRVGEALASAEHVPRSSGDALGEGVHSSSGHSAR